MSQNLARVGLASVGVCGLVALEVIWGVGTRVEREVELAGAADLIDAASTFAFRVRPMASGLVALLFGLAVLEQGNRPSVRFLVALAFLQLSIAGALGVALWLPYRPITISGPIR